MLVACRSTSLQGCGGPSVSRPKLKRLLRRHVLPPRAATACCRKAPRDLSLSLVRSMPPSTDPLIHPSIHRPIVRPAEAAFASTRGRPRRGHVTSAAARTRPGSGAGGISVCLCLLLLPLPTWRRTYGCVQDRAGRTTYHVVSAFSLSDLSSARDSHVRVLAC